MNFCYFIDELRHILSSDTTRRGLFALFDMFQYKALNKRFIYVLIENLLINLFPINNQTSSKSEASSVKSSQLQAYIRNYLAKSPRVRPEWKKPTSVPSQQSTIPVSINNGNSKNSTKSMNNVQTTPVTFNSSSSLPRSKTMHSYVQC